MKLKEIFYKQGGRKLIAQYIRSNVIGTAIGEFILLGKSRIALEILRLSTYLKQRQRLEKQYMNILKSLDSKNMDSLPHNSSNNVWICWLQGLEKAPAVVKKCYQSVKDNLYDRNIVLITENNMGDYVKFPDYIMDKWKAGIITNTHLTDLLRLELLIRYGGLWLDATVLCSDKRENIPDYFFDSDLFFFQNLKPGRDGNSIYNSSWLICSKSNNRVLIATRELCYEYWKRNNIMDNYFLFHLFFSMVLEYYKSEWNSVVPRDNSAPHILLLRMFDQYNERIWEAVKAQTPFHKISYKFSEEKKDMRGTYYDVIFGGGVANNLTIILSISNHGVVNQRMLVAA